MEEKNSIYNKLAEVAKYLPFFFIVAQTVSTYTVMLALSRDDSFLISVFSITIVTSMFVLIGYVIYLYAFLVYGALKKSISKKMFFLTLLVQLAAITFGSIVNVYEYVGTISLDIYMAAISQGYIANTMGETLVISGFAFSIIHLSILTMIRKKLNINSIANVFISWSFAMVIITIVTRLI